MKRSKQMSYVSATMSAALVIAVCCAGCGKNTPDAANTIVLTNGVREKGL